MTTGAGGADPTGGGVVGPATGVGSNTTTGTESTGSLTTSSGSSTGTGGNCKPGGTACQAFGECCSGTCSNQVCTACFRTHVARAGIFCGHPHEDLPRCSRPCPAPRLWDCSNTAAAAAAPAAAPDGLRRGALPR